MNLVGTQPRGDSVASQSAVWCTTGAAAATPCSGALLRDTRDTVVVLGPMEVRTFVVTLQPPASA